MKYLALAKPVSDSDVAHVYEHMFATSLTYSMRESGLLPYVDYSFDAKTYHKGILWCELMLFSAQAKHYETLIESHKVAIDDDSINAALLQVMAEKRCDVDSLSKALMRKALIDINARQWVTTENAAIMEGVVKDESPSLRLVSGKQDFLVLQQDIVIDTMPLRGGQSRLLLPLAIVLARIIQATLQEDIPAEAFCYSYGSEWIEVEANLQLRDYYRVDAREGIKIDDLKQVATKLKTRLLQPDATRRIRTITDLENTGPTAAPASQDVLEFAGVFVGREYWREHVDVNLIEVALRCITIDFAAHHDNSQ